MRYTQQAESLDFGLLTASEADAPYSEGKDFYALRLNKNSEKFSLGYLGTFTERPVINREATVHALDLTYRPTDQLRLSTVLMGSNIEQESRSSGATDNTSGQAFNIDVTASPKKNRWHNLSMFYFDDQVDINDMGYQMINNWSFISNQNGFKFTEFNPDSFLLSSELGVAFGIETNGKFETASRSVQLDYKSNFKNTSGLTIENFYRDASKDFWITRNDLTAPFINKPANYGTKIQFFGPSSNRFSYGLTFAREKGSAWFSALGFSTTYTAMANFTPRDNLKFSLTYQHNDEEHWLNWIENNLLGTYTKKQRTTVASMNWFGGDKHELRIKAQMVAFTARNPSAFLGDGGGALNSVDIDLPPFSLSDLAFQIRYRYEILPLAYLYVVYSKGGRIVETDEEDRLSKLYQRPWNDPQADNFTVKLRYRF